MKAKAELRRIIAGVTALLLALSPLNIDGTGLIKNGIIVTASAEKNPIPNENEIVVEEESDYGSVNGISDANTEDDDSRNYENIQESDAVKYSGDIEEEVWISTDSFDIPDNDQLFDKYVTCTFYGNTADYSRYGYLSLINDAEREIYNLLKTEIENIANGLRSDTQITLIPENIWDYSKASFHRIFEALLTDIPYELYWFDKVGGLKLSYNLSLNRFTFKFSVAEAYALPEDYTANTSKTGAASLAAANAYIIANKYASSNDIKKLNGYREEICELVSYNRDAVNNNEAYGDPWQLIYVFDNDPTTNVVCEGYSKAFQYLCDITEFENASIESAIVWGRTSGAHMWNIVSINNVSYTVDITNCDSGTIGYPDLLFLKGMGEASSDGFVFYGSRNITYTYDEDVISIYSPEFLTVSTDDFVAYTYIEVSEYLNWSVNGTPMTDNSATLSSGDTVTIRLGIEDYFNHIVAINNQVVPLKLSDDNTYFYITLETDNCGGSISVEYIKSQWDSEELSSYAHLDIGDNVIAYPYTDRVVSERRLFSGDYYPVGKKIMLNVSLRDYVNHKLTINGEEVLPCKNGDNVVFIYEYTVDSSRVNIELSEEKWNKEKLSDFIKLDINDNISVYPYNEYMDSAITNYPLSSGDYYPKNSGLVIRIPEEIRNGRAIIINSVKAEGALNSDNDYEIRGYSVDCLSDTLTIDTDENYSRLSFNEKVNVYRFDVEKDEADLTSPLHSGYYYPKNSTAFVSVRLNDYINHALKINGSVTELEINGDNVCLVGIFQLTDSEVTVELQDKTWTEEELSSYTKLDINDVFSVYPYNSYIQSAVTGNKLKSGDYYPKNKTLVIRIPEEIRKGKNILINGVIAYGNITPEDNYEITVYPSDYEGNTLSIIPESALVLKDNNGQSENFDTLNDAFGYINKNGSSDSSFIVTLNCDISVSALTLPGPTKARSITFNGRGALKLDTTSLTVPTNVIFEVPVEGTKPTPLSIRVAAGKKLAITGADSKNIGSISGTSSSVLYIGTDITVNGISTFGELTSETDNTVTVKGNVSSIGEFNGELRLTAPQYSATITKIGIARIVLDDVNGTNAAVTVSDINESGKLEILLIDDNCKETAVESGRTVLRLGSSADFTSRVHIVNRTESGKALNAYLYGKEIKAEYGGTITLYDGNSTECLGNYPNLELAFKRMNDTAKDYLVSINEDIYAPKLTLPTKAKSIYLSSNGKTIRTDSSSVSLPVNVTISNTNIETTSKYGLTITAVKSLNAIAFASESLVALKGGSKSVLTLSESAQESIYTLGCAISGFGTIVLNGTTALTGTVKAASLQFGAGASLYVGNNSVTFTNVIGDNKNSIIYTVDDYKPVTISGGVTAENPIEIGKKTENGFERFSEEATLLSAKTADLSGFTILSSCKPIAKDIEDYTLARAGSDVKVKPVVFRLHWQSVRNNIVGNASYALWSDVLSTISAKSKNDKELTYSVLLKDDLDLDGSFKMPAAKTYRSITFMTEYGKETKTITFTGNITLTGDTSFVNLYLNSENTVKGVISSIPFTISTGKYNLSVNDVRGEIKSISSSGIVSLGGTTIGTISADRIVIESGTEPEEANQEAMNGLADEGWAGKEAPETSVNINGNLTAKSSLIFTETSGNIGSLTVTGVINATQIESRADGAALVIYKSVGNKAPLVIGKGGVANSSEKINLVLMSPENGKTAQITSDVVFGTISGEYADKFIPASESLANEESFYIIKSGKNLIARPTTDPSLITARINGIEAYYESLTAAVNDISATGRPIDKIEIILDSACYDLAKLPLPTAGRYNELVLSVESGSAIINVTSDITLTGKLTIGEGVTINKLKITGRGDNAVRETVPIIINSGKYSLTCYGMLSPDTEAGINRIQNINGTGLIDFGTTDVQVTGTVKAGKLILNDNTVTLGTSFSGDILSQNGTLAYKQTAYKNIRFGTIYGSELTLDIGETAENLKIASITGDYLKDGAKLKNSDLTVARSGNYLSAIKTENSVVVVEETNEAESTERRYDSIESALSDITRIKHSGSEYTIKISKNAKTALSMPKAGTYKSIRLKGESGAEVLETTKDITLTGGLYAEDIAINKVDRYGNLLPVSINLNCYSLYAGDSARFSANQNGENQFVNIIGKNTKTSVSSIDIQRASIINGRLNVGSINIACTITLGGKASFAAAEIIPMNDSRLVYPLSISKNLKLGNIDTAYSKLRLNITNIVNNEDKGIYEGVQIAALTGDYTFNAVIIGDGNRFSAVRSGTKLIAAYEDKAVIVEEILLDSTVYRAYDTYTSAINDITRLNNKNGTYVLTLSESKYELSKLVLPAKGKYQKLYIKAYVPSVIEIRSDISLTGDIVIGENVTLRKVKYFKDENSIPLKISSAISNGYPVFSVAVTENGIIENARFNGMEIESI